MQVTDEMVAKAVEAWHHDWRSGPPEQNETSAMRAALTAALAKAWRPIESAPIGTHSHDRIAVGFEGQFGWILFTAYPKGKDTAVPGYAKPTHWIPLPPPPATKEAAER